MSSSVTLKAAGLNFSPNALSLPEGSLLEANDVFIRRGDIIESRRGVNQWSQGLGSIDEPIQQLMQYKDRILAQYGNTTIAFDAGYLNSLGKEVFTDFAGVYSEAQTGLRTKYVEANGNLYFTSSEGIQKISATNADEFAITPGYITTAGAVQSLNIQASLLIQQGQVSGFLPPDSTVNYATVWGYNDTNKNLLLGVPSNFVEVYNYLLDIIPLDLNELLILLDTINQTIGGIASLISDGNYSTTYYSPLGTAATTLQNNVIDLAIKLDKDLQFASMNAPTTQVPLEINTMGMNAGGVVTITFTPPENPALYMSTNDYINIAGLNATNSVSISSVATGNPTVITVSSTQGMAVGSVVTISGTNTGLDGAQTVTAFTPTTFTIPVSTVFNISNIIPNGTTATIVSASPHGLQNGDTVIFTGNTSTGLTDGPPGYIIFNTTSTQFDITATITVVQTDGTFAPSITSGTVTLPTFFFANGPQKLTSVTPTTSFTITGNTAANPTVVTTSTPHGLSDGDTIFITGSNSTPSLDGIQVVDNVTTNTFTVPVNVTIAGTTGTVIESGSIQFIYTQPVGTGLTAIVPIVPNLGTTINSYAYEHITNSADNIITTALVNNVVDDPATNGELQVIEHTIYRIWQRLQVELPNVIPTLLQTDYIAPYSITTAGNAEVLIQIPDGILVGGANIHNYFVQVYRSSTFQASGPQVLGGSSGLALNADDELKLVFEHIPTAAEIAAGQIVFDDSTPDALVENNTNLYTNPITGVGILNANAIPPLALDINVYKNVTFFANTRGPFAIDSFQLLGVTGIHDGDTITIATATTSQTYTFVAGVQQVTGLYFGPDAGTTNITQNEYFYMYNADDQYVYYPWYNVDNTGTIDVDPTSPYFGHITPPAPPVPSPLPYQSFAYDIAAQVTPPVIPIRVDILSTWTNAQVAQKTLAVINDLIFDFQTSGSLQITGITPVAGNTTITTLYDNNLAPGEVITITGVTQTAGTTINGTQTVVSATTNSFTISTPVLPVLTLPFNTNSPLASVVLNSTIYVTNVSEGESSPINIGTMTAPFAVQPEVVGAGEDIAKLQVLLSQLPSAAQNIDITAQSLARVINGQTAGSLEGDSPVYAYYISGTTTQPGIIELKEKTLSDVPFYVIGSTLGVGASFNPNISPDNYFVSPNPNSIPFITSIAFFDATDAVITTAFPHGLQNGNQIIITGSNSVPIVDGEYTVTVLNNFQFTIPIPAPITVPGPPIPGTPAGSWSLLSDTVVSINDVNPNRVFYSTINQPESVPLLNYIDLGSKDKSILRIFPLRDSLFVFKEDGLFRISGDIAPYYTQLFDVSCILIAPDTVSALSNQVYGWTRKGITTITESGTSEISKPISNVLQTLQASAYPNFETITWGLGYESDLSYTVYTNNLVTDTVPTIGFRYCTLTNTWTNIVKKENCGVILNETDIMYLGNAASNDIQQERKQFNRTDYADNEYYLQLLNNPLSNNGFTINLPGFSDVNGPGDVITQNQLVTIYDFNQLLLQLDADLTVGITPMISPTTSVGLTVTFNADTSTMVTGDYITISDSNSTPSLNGDYQITVLDATHFTIQVPIPLMAQATIATIKRNYFLMFQAFAGDNLRNDLVNLAHKLDTDPVLIFGNYFNIINSYSGIVVSASRSDPTVLTVSTPFPTYIGQNPNPLIDGRIITISGAFIPNSIPSIDGTWTISTPTTNTFTIPLDVTTASGIGGIVTYDTAPNLQSFEDIQACFNGIVNALIADSGTTFKHYVLVTTTTLFEAVILSINPLLGQVTMNLALQWIVGDITLYNAIPSEIIYAPITFGDPLSYKHLYEATIMFDNRAFTQATISFSSDLKPEFLDVPFTLQGNGIFGHYTQPGFGYGFFGGSSNGAPVRTLIPQQSQRCRYMNVKYNHTVARELCNMLGITITGNVAQSTRAYR